MVQESKQVLELCRTPIPMEPGSISPQGCNCGSASQGLEGQERIKERVAGWGGHRFVKQVERREDGSRKEAWRRS